MTRLGGATAREIVDELLRRVDAAEVCRQLNLLESTDLHALAAEVDGRTHHERALLVPAHARFLAERGTADEAPGSRNGLRLVQDTAGATNGVQTK